MNQTRIAKTFYEVIGKFNPYHDRLGRFATKDGFMASNWNGDRKRQAVTFSANPNTSYGAKAIARESGEAHEIIGRAYETGTSTAKKPPKRSKPTAKPQKQNKPKTDKPKNNDNKVVEFKPAKTKKEAIEYAKKQLGFDTVSYGSKMNLETINHINKQVADIQAKYPETKGAVQTLKTTSSSRMYACIEYDYSGAMAFKVSSTLYGSGLNNLEKSYNRDLEAGFHPKGTSAKDIVWHEYGHVIAGVNSKKRVGFAANETLDFSSRSKYFDDRRSGGWEKSVYKKAALTMAQYNIEGKVAVDYRKMAKKISRYAEKNIKELFAEAFAEFNGSDNPSPESIALMKAAGLFK